MVVWANEIIRLREKSRSELQDRASLVESWSAKGLSNSRYWDDYYRV